MKSILELIKKEESRQNEHVELIASENFVSREVLKAAGSVLTNKYAEGYPNRRYYGGCEVVDEIETRAIEAAKTIFKAKYANVQPHSGSQANLAAYLAVIKPGAKILGMSLTSGGHLTHGYFVSATGQIFHSEAYEVNPETHLLDYDAIEAQAIKFKPDLIICGASAYSRVIDFKRFRKIADKVGAYLLADVAHIAGLIVAGLHPNPIEDCHIVTTTTHKTLRGPRGGMILTNDAEIAKKIDRAVFPGTQGGPLMHIIAAKAIAFEEAMQPDFIEYQKQILKNTEAMANYFISKDVKVITNGTDNHLFMLDVKQSFNISGDRAEKLLLNSNIILNKNTIPFDQEKPTVASGVRIGTPAMTTKGFKENDFIMLGEIIYSILKANDDDFAKMQQAKILQLLAKYQ